MTDRPVRRETHATWMIYGANGYTGVLVAEEAVRCGHRPLLAGRCERKLIPVAERLGLDWVVAPLDDANALAAAVSRADLVYHAAGPFVLTVEPMIRACLATNTNYVDITGELAVFRKTFSYDRAATSKKVALMSGAGFDVIPTDCLAEYVANQVPNATKLEIAVDGFDQASPGTTKTMLEMLPQGNWVRRGGELIPHGWGTGAKKIRFPKGTSTAIPVPWGDLETAFQTTGISDITTFLAFPKRLTRILRWTAPLAQRMLRITPIRRILQRVVERTVAGPEAATRQRTESYVWARATDNSGYQVQAWLEAPEIYQFTAAGAIRCVERILDERPIGALTPALAFGADFVLEVQGTRRLDSLYNGAKTRGL